MIMARNEDGTYSQVGFVKDNAGIDTEYIYDKDGDIVFEKGFTRETSGTVPLTINGIGKDLKDWSITGNTVQNGTPTPENPVEVQAVGERTRNLFPLDETKLHVGRIESDGTITYKIGTISVGTDSITYQSKDIWRGFYTDYIPVTALEVKLTLLSVTSSLACSCNCYDTDGNFLGKATGKSSNNTRTFDLIAETAKIRINVTSDMKQYTITNPMLNIGSTALPYEPYGYKIPVVTRGKNLFDKENASPKAVTNQGVFVSNSSYISSNYISVSPNTTYTKIPIIKSSQFHDLCEYDENKIFIRHIFTANNGTFTTSEKTKYIVFNIAKFNIDIAQLEEGTTATPYEAYHEPITTPIYLDSPLYKIGDYADRLSKTEEVRVVKELVLTGKENWIKSVAYKGSFYAQIVTGILSETYTAFCSHLAFSTLSRYAKGKFCFNGDITKNCNLWLNQFDSSTTVADFKAYLAAQYAAGTPVKVYYVVQTPETKTVEPVEIPTLNGTTVIDVDTAVKPTEMYTKYKSSK